MATNSPYYVKDAYGPGKVLLVGDAPGDRAAAAEAGAFFYPILPGHEAESWRDFRETALPRFFAGDYAVVESAADLQKTCLPISGQIAQEPRRRYQLVVENR